MIDTVSKIGKIQVIRWPRAARWTDGVLNLHYVPKGSWKTAVELSYTKYNIKETDFRIKTATFTSPNYIDLTEGLTAVRISSVYHENFAGIILDVDYEPETGLYNYQCQDFSRIHMFITDTKIPPKTWSIYTLLTSLITHGNITDLYKNGVPHSFTKSDRDFFADELSGLKPLRDYDQSLYEGNKWKGNPFKNKPAMVLRNKPIMELVRDIVYGSLGFFDVWINERGVIQIDPIIKEDWEKTGLHLTTENALKEKYTFSTTNAITQVTVTGSGKNLGSTFPAKNLLSSKLDLGAFFGSVSASISDPTSASKNTSNATKTNSSTTKTTNKDNPYGNKAKKIWIGADNGSGDFCRAIVKELQKHGWTCHYSGEGSNLHCDDYKNVTSDYQLIGVVDNGFCCTTVKEAYEDGHYSEMLKRKKVTPMFIFDTRSWTDNSSRGMGPFRYGDFKNHVFSTAWDDPTGYCRTMNATAFFKKHKAVYCAGPTVKHVVDMFLAGGYFAMHGIKV